MRAMTHLLMGRHARSRSVVALRGFGLCHVSRYGRHSGYRAGETQNPQEVQKCRKRGTNAMTEHLISFFLSPLLFVFALGWTLGGMICHLIPLRWHICLDSTNSGLVILRHWPQPPILRPLLFLAFSPSCASTPHCFALFCFSVPEQHSVPVM